MQWVGKYNRHEWGKTSGYLIQIISLPTILRSNIIEILSPGHINLFTSSKARLNLEHCQRIIKGIISQCFTVKVNLFAEWCNTDGVEGTVCHAFLPRGLSVAHSFTQQLIIYHP